MWFTNTLKEGEANVIEGGRGSKICYYDATAVVWVNGVSELLLRSNNCVSFFNPVYRSVFFLNNNTAQGLVLAAKRQIHNTNETFCKQ